MSAESRPQTPEDYIPMADHLKVVGQLERAQDRNRVLEKIVKTSSAEDEGARIIASAIAENIQARPPVPTSRYRAKKHSPEYMGGILDIGDVHAYEVVQARNTGGLFQYNSEIAAKRYDYTIEEAIEIARFHKIGSLSLVFGGDLISGAIHDDLNRHNETMVAEQAIGFSETAYEGLEKLLSAGIKLDTYWLSGNHGRTMNREKPYFKNKQQENWDWIVAKMVEAYAKNEKNLNIVIPDTVWCVFEVAKRRFLALHGDTIRFQKSMGISFYAIEKEMRRLKTMIADGTIPAHQDVISHHLHQCFAVPIGDTMWYNNGALKGPDEYGHMGLRPPEEAQQQMLIVEDGRVRAHYSIVSQHIGKPS